MATEPGAVRLNEVFQSGVRSLEQNVSNPFEKATAFFLFGSLQQFFFDGNKRTSRAMMNGVLMTEGIDAVSIPAVRAAEFNSRMVDFYTSRDATEMMAFVLDCHPEVSQIRQLNPGILAVMDLPDIKYFSLGGSTKQTNDDTHSTDPVDRDSATDSDAG
jgi:prophage maintenance system killer protein